jgi:hypothetical protein
VTATTKILALLTAILISILISGFAYANINDYAELPTQTNTPSPTQTPAQTISPIAEETPTQTPSHAPSPTPSSTTTPLPSTSPTLPSPPSQSTTPTPTNAPGQSRFKISGYIIDSDGRGLEGANIIFCVPDIVPSVISQSTGYYEIYAPAGEYHLIVWPPFDSNYIYYDQPNFAVGSDLTKNITLAAGCKVSGYINDSLGNPVSGGIVALGNYISGWFSKSTGYYFTTAPAGTYTLEARPKAGSDHFPKYRESNFVVTGSTFKNITLNGPLTTLPSPSATPTQTPTPNPSSYIVSGYILDSDGLGIADAGIIVTKTGYVSNAISDENGRYELSASAGVYSLIVSRRKCIPKHIACVWLQALRKRY